MGEVIRFKPTWEFIHILWFNITLVYQEIDRVIHTC